MSSKLHSTSVAKNIESFEEMLSEIKLHRTLYVTAYELEGIERLTYRLESHSHFIIIVSNLTANVYHIVNRPRLTDNYRYSGSYAQIYS